MNPSTMNSVEISKSSLVGLRAELLKKQDEVKKLKELKQNSWKPVLRPKKISITQKSNEGVESRSLKDSESLQDDFDVLKKSREILEAKSRLYDKLKEGCVDSDAQSQYLTDFNLKQQMYDKSELACKRNEESSQLFADEETYYSDNNSDPENDWVDFVDALGRTRHCLRKNLEEMKAKDSKLAKSLQPPSPPHDPEATPDLISWDMQREHMREKWEEQEIALLEKKDIHYQDLLFDEARPHGVSYFEFSTNENERLKQQEGLKNLRNKTLEQQEAAEGLRIRRQQQLEARLAAARRRRWERLGLPPDEPQPQESKEKIVSNTDLEHNTEDEVKDLKESIKRNAAVRPWDVGKKGVCCVMSQEEWIEKKRQERQEEFAPPNSKLKMIEDKKSFAFNGPKNKPHIQIIQNYTSSTEKLSNHQIKSKTLIKNESFGSIFEDRRPNSFQFAAEDKLHSTPDPEVGNWKKTSEEIDTLLLRAKANCSSPVLLKDYPKNVADFNTRLSKNNTRKVFTVKNHKTKLKHGNLDLLGSTDSSVELDNGSCSEDQTNSVFEFSNISDVGINEETQYQRTFNQKKAYNSSSTNKKYPVSSSEECYIERNDTNQPNSTKRKWAEVSPPISMSYYISNDAHKEQNTDSSIHLASSISVGFDYLKSRTEEKEKKHVKGLLDII